MDISKFQKDREAKLSAFKKDNEELKAKYAALLSQALNERDSEKQAELIRQILEVNSSLAANVRAFISDQTSYDPKMSEKLTAELVAYQNQYNSIQKSKDVNTTLNMILHENQNKLESLVFQFNFFLVFLILGILVLLYFIFKTPGDIIPIWMQAQPPSILEPPQ